jgi:ribonuclease HIII
MPKTKRERKVTKVAQTKAPTSRPASRPTVKPKTANPKTANPSTTNLASTVDDRAVERVIAQEVGADFKDFTDVVGIDETRRGCLMGAVVAASCILPDHVKIPGIMDSKKIKTEAQREKLFELITNHPDIHFAWHSID